MLSYAFRHWENTPLSHIYSLNISFLIGFHHFSQLNRGLVSHQRSGHLGSSWQFPRFWRSFMCSSFDFAQNHPNKTSQSKLDYEHLLALSWCCDFLTISYLEKQRTHITCRQGTVYAEMPLTGLSLARINDRTDVSGEAATCCRLLQ